MDSDELSMSFASSMGIEDCQQEYLHRDDLYNDLNQLEKSVQAEFEQIMIQARSFPFNEDMEHQDESELDQRCEVNETLEGDSADQVLEHVDTNVGSWQQYFDNSVGERYHANPMRNSSLSDASQTLEHKLGQQNSRSTSPGEYFGARSLPLASIDRVWEEHYIDSQQDHSVREDEYTYSLYTSQNRKKTAMDDLIDNKFKSLPKSLRLFPKYELPEIELHHPYTQQRTRSNGSSLSSTHQQCASRNQQEPSNSISRSRSIQSLSNRHGYTSPISNNCVIEPSSPLRFLCEISSKTIYAKVIHLKITNPIPNTVRTFNLYSTKSLLDFEFSEGMIQAEETVEIKIKIRASVLIPYQRQQFDEYPSLADKILVLIDHSQANELDVFVDFMNLDDEEEEEEASVKNDPEPSQMTSRPKCRFCALEKGYPLYSL